MEYDIPLTDWIYDAVITIHKMNTENNEWQIDD